MSFLDNLESNLKSLEARDEAADQRSQQVRTHARTAALAAAPWAEKLRKSAYTEELLRQATRIGFGIRLKVRMTWLDTTLRLEAAGRKLELRPTPEGIVAVFAEGPNELRREAVDLEKDGAEALARRWLQP